MFVEPLKCIREQARPQAHRNGRPDDETETVLKGSHIYMIEKTCRFEIPLDVAVIVLTMRLVRREQDSESRYHNVR